MSVKCAESAEKLSRSKIGDRLDMEYIIHKLLRSPGLDY